MRRITIRLTKADHISLVRAAEFYKMDVGKYMTEIALADARRLLPILENGRAEDVALVDRRPHHSGAKDDPHRRAVGQLRKGPEKPRQGITPGS
jgi:hypothetical protein